MSGVFRWWPNRSDNGVIPGGGPGSSHALGHHKPVSHNYCSLKGLQACVLHQEQPPCLPTRESWAQQRKPCNKNE